MAKVHVIHENGIWVEPLRAAFNELGTPFEEWFLDRGVLDLRAAPPEGVFYNRMSASSHTRDHRYAAEYTGAVLAWLERHGRLVVNDSRALRLEISKVAQYEALGAFGIPTPDTLAAIGKENIVAAAERLGFPLILKHNRGGKGLGVRLFLSRPALDEHLASSDFEEPIDGITLVQRYIEAPEPFITRLEFVGGRFLYAVRVDTSQGFELCPADACAVDARSIGSGSCPALAPAEKFRVVERYQNPLIPTYERFLAKNGIGIAGIEVITDRRGRSWTYDVNTNTNYNPEAEARAGVSGMKAIARHLDRQLKALTWQAGGEQAA
ncbi:MAG: RimK family alpha-L-glutamate ligase [Microvirga sp.]